MSGENALRTVFILGLSSDIGRELASRYSERGFTVIGTCRNKKDIENLQKNNIYPISCDLSDDNSISSAIKSYSGLRIPWDIFISCIGTMNPIGKFMDVDFLEWEKSVEINALKQLLFLHSIYPYRRENSMCNVAFFAGGGTNGPFPNYSAYCASKIFLIKMCELLDDEIPDMNPFIVGPGWVRTKIHTETLSNLDGAGNNYQRTIDFLKSDEPGTSFDEIFDCINWCIRQGKSIAGGRNFSLVHDLWRENNDSSLVEQLREESNKFKLRRFNNSN